MVFSDTVAQELEPATPSPPEELTGLTGDAGKSSSEPGLPDDLASYLDNVERDILERALERHRFNRTAAGASLGLSLRQMRYRMARLGVTVGGDSGSERT
jgi:two-component system, NtrC family, response regulator PilR